MGRIDEQHVSRPAPLVLDITAADEATALAAKRAGWGVGFLWQPPRTAGAWPGGCEGTTYLHTSARPAGPLMYSTRTVLLFSSTHTVPSRGLQSTGTT